MENISQTIESLSLGNPDELLEIQASLCPVSLQKGDYLLKEGQVCTDYYFIETGSVRLFYTKDIKEYTVWIGTAGEIFTNLESYLNETSSRINIQAIDPSVVYTISKVNSDTLAQKSNPYNTLLRKTVETAFVGLSQNVMSFQSEEATERYQRFIAEKNWVAKYPLKYLSTFIGVTQSTLSRLRAKR